MSSRFKNPFRSKEAFSGPEVDAETSENEGAGHTEDTAKNYSEEASNVYDREFAEEKIPISSSDVEDILTVSKRTAQRYLISLVRKGLIEKQGDKKGAKYLMLN